MYITFALSPLFGPGLHQECRHPSANVELATERVPRKVKEVTLGTAHIRETVASPGNASLPLTSHVPSILRNMWLGSTKNGGIGAHVIPTLLCTTSHPVHPAGDTPPGERWARQRGVHWYGCTLLDLGYVNVIVSSPFRCVPLRQVHNSNGATPSRRCTLTSAYTSLLRLHCSQQYTTSVVYTKRSSAHHVQHCVVCTERVCTTGWCNSPVVCRSS